MGVEHLINSIEEIEKQTKNFRDAIKNGNMLPKLENSKGEKEDDEQKSNNEQKKFNEQVVKNDKQKI